MKTKAMRATLIIMIGIIIGCFGYSLTAYAKGVEPINEKYTTANGDIFIVKNGKLRSGWVNFKGATYYCHKTESLEYPKYSVYAGGYKIIHGKWYCFDSLGRLVKKDTRSLDIRSKDHSVRYIYGTSMKSRGLRYSTSARRYQEMDEKGKWHDVGMEIVPAGWANTQR